MLLVAGFPLVSPGADAAVLANEKRRLAAKYLSEASDSIDKIGYARYRVEALSRLADSWLQAGDMTRAAAAHERAVRCGAQVEEFSPGNDSEVWASVRFAQIQARLGDLAGAEKTINAIVDKTQSQTSKKEWAAILARAGELPRAMQLVENLAEPSRDDARHAIVISLVQRKDFAAAEKLLDQIVHRQVMEHSAAVLAVGYTKSGDSVAAMKAAGLITDPSYAQKVIIAVARAQKTAGKTHDALATVRRARAAAEKVTKLSTRVSAWCDVAVALSEVGDGPAAARMLEEAAELQKSVKPEPSPLGGPPMFYNPLPHAYASIGDFAAAIRSANGDEEYLGFVYEQEVERGDIQAGMRAADKLTDSIPRNNLLLRVARAQNKAGDLAGARKTLSRLDSADAQIEMQASLYHGVIGRTHAERNDLQAFDEWASSLRRFPTIHAHLLLGAARGLIGAVDDDSFDYEVY